MIDQYEFDKAYTPQRYFSSSITTLTRKSNNRLFDRIDVNEDGVLERDEWASHWNSQNQLRELQSGPQQNPPGQSTHNLAHHHALSQGYPHMDFVRTSLNAPRGLVAPRVPHTQAQDHLSTPSHDPSRASLRSHRFFSEFNHHAHQHHAAQHHVQQSPAYQNMAANDGAQPREVTDSGQDYMGHWTGLEGWFL